MMTGAVTSSRWRRWQTDCGRRSRTGLTSPSRAAVQDPGCSRSNGLLSLRPAALVGTSAPGWNSGTPGSQSFRAACTRASTLADESSSLASPAQPQVQRAWCLRRSRTTTTTPCPSVESPIIAKLTTVKGVCSSRCSPEPLTPPPFKRVGLGYGMECRWEMPASRLRVYCRQCKNDSCVSGARG